MRRRLCRSTAWLWEFRQAKRFSGRRPRADRNVDAGALPLLFFVVLFDYLSSLSLICVVVERELCVRDLYRTHLSLPNRKKNTPGLSYLFFSSSSSSALTRQGIPELKTFLEGFVFICRIFWYSSRGQLYFYDRRSCWRVESFDWLLHEIQVNAQSLTRNKRRR